MKTDGFGNVSLICMPGKRCVLFMFEAAEYVSPWVSAVVGYAGCREHCKRFHATRKITHTEVRVSYCSHPIRVVRYGTGDNTHGD